MNTTGLIFTILGGLAGVAALIWAAAQYRFSRRRTVRISRTKTALVQRGAGASNLEIRLRDSNVEVKSPYSVTLTLAAQRPADVTVESFGGRPLRIEVGTSVVSLISVEGHPDAVGIMAAWRRDFLDETPVSDPWPDYLELPPALLSVTQPWSVTVLCDGDPDPRVTVRLANVDFLTNLEAKRRSITRTRKIALIAMLCSVVATIVTGLIAGTFVASAVFSLALPVSVAIYMLSVGRFEHMDEF